MTELSGGVNINRNPTLQVAWAFESCARLITGGIKVSVLGQVFAGALPEQAAGSRNSRGSDCRLGSGGTERQRLQRLHASGSVHSACPHVSSTPSMRMNWAERSALPTLRPVQMMPSDKTSSKFLGLQVRSDLCGCVPG